MFLLFFIIRCHHPLPSVRTVRRNGAHHLLLCCAPFHLLLRTILSFAAHRLGKCCPAFYVLLPSILYFAAQHFILWCARDLVRVQSSSSRADCFFLFCPMSPSAITTQSQGFHHRGGGERTTNRINIFMPCLMPFA